MGAGCLRVVCWLERGGFAPPTREDKDGKSSAPPTRASPPPTLAPRAPRARPAHPPATRFPPPPPRARPSGALTQIGELFHRRRPGHGRYAGVRLLPPRRHEHSLELRALGGAGAPRGARRHLARRASSSVILRGSSLVPVPRVPLHRPRLSAFVRTEVDVHAQRLFPLRLGHRAAVFEALVVFEFLRALEDDELLREALRVQTRVVPGVVVPLELVVVAVVHEFIRRGSAAQVTRLVRRLHVVVHRAFVVKVFTAKATRGVPRKPAERRVQLLRRAPLVPVQVLPRVRHLLRHEHLPPFQAHLAEETVVRLAQVRLELLQRPERARVLFRRSGAVLRRAHRTGQPSQLLHLAAHREVVEEDVELLVVVQLARARAAGELRERLRADGLRVVAHRARGEHGGAPLLADDAPLVVHDEPKPRDALHARVPVPARAIRHVRQGLRADHAALLHGASARARRPAFGRRRRYCAEGPHGTWTKSARRRQRSSARSDSVPVGANGDFSTRHKQSVEYASQIRRLPVSHSIRPLGPTHSAFGFERFTPSVAVAIWRASR
jgi:hypothetical protein